MYDLLIEAIYSVYCNGNLKYIEASENGFKEEINLFFGADGEVISLKTKYVGDNRASVMQHTDDTLIGLVDFMVPTEKSILVKTNNSMKFSEEETKVAINRLYNIFKNMLNLSPKNMKAYIMSKNDKEKHRIMCEAAKINNCEITNYSYEEIRTRLLYDVYNFYMRYNKGHNIWEFFSRATSVDDSEFFRDKWENFLKEDKLDYGDSETKVIKKKK